MKLTKAQRRVLQHVADNGPLVSTYHHWPRDVLPRVDARRRLWQAGLLSTPNMNREGSGRWEITEAGRSALRPSNEGESNNG